MRVRFKKLSERAVTPQYAKPGDAGMDLVATSLVKNEVFYEYGTDIAVEIPEGYVGLVFPRSSISKTKQILANHVGVVDCVPAGTKIKTPDGDVLVEDIFNSEKYVSVYSYNEELNTIEEDLISDMWIVNDKELLKITTENGDSVEIPLEKEVFTKSGWKMCKNLTTDDEILTF